MHLAADVFMLFYIHDHIKTFLKLYFLMEVLVWLHLYMYVILYFRKTHIASKI